MTLDEEAQSMEERTTNIPTQLPMNKIEVIIAYHNKAMRTDMASEISGGTRSKAITDVITVKAIAQLIAQQRTQAVQEFAEGLDKEFDASRKRAGHGSRTQFSKDTETVGEAYSRTQGFKSGMIIAKQKLQSALTDLTPQPIKQRSDRSETI